MRLQVPGKAALARGAEGAAHGAAHLQAHLLSAQPCQRVQTRRAPQHCRAVSDPEASLHPLIADITLPQEVADWYQNLPF